MKLAALYDVHGNLPALEAVLAEIRREGVDRVVVGGDVVPGPMPRETLARLLDLDMPVQFIQGNGEAVVLAHLAGADPGTLPQQARAVVPWTAEQLHPEDQQALAAWPLTLRLVVEGWGEVLFCHSTPRNHTEIFTRQTPEDVLRPIFDAAGASLVVCGHTHMQFDRTIGRTRVVNAGSVGMPFGEPGADWLLLGSDIQLRHTQYDLAKAADRVRATSYPEAADFAARYVLQPPSEKQMLAAFAPAELT